MDRGTVANQGRGAGRGPGGQSVNRGTLPADGYTRSAYRVSETGGARVIGSCCDRVMRSGCVGVSIAACWSMPCRITRRRWITRQKPETGVRSPLVREAGMLIRGYVQRPLGAFARRPRTSCSTVEYRFCKNQQHFSCDPAYCESVNYSCYLCRLRELADSLACNALQSRLAAESQMFADCACRRPTPLGRHSTFWTSPANRSAASTFTANDEG